MNRRGVSPVVAVLLLVVITVAAAVLVYIWLIGFMQSQTATTGSTSTTDFRASDARHRLSRGRRASRDNRTGLQL